MSQTSTPEDLLQACVQDLHAARKLIVQRLGPIAANAGKTLATELESLRQAYAGEANEFEGAGLSLDGPPNLWMDGILDDAERDTRSIERGPLLDVALIGAIRKGVAADGVSLETAREVADSLGNARVAELASAMRERSHAADAALRALLERIA